MSKAGPAAAAELSEQGVSVIALAVCCVIIKVICAMVVAGANTQAGVRVSELHKSPHFPSTASTLPHNIPTTCSSVHPPPGQSPSLLCGVPVKTLLAVHDEGWGWCEGEGPPSPVL